jgi:hypothetical protein
MQQGEFIVLLLPLLTGGCAREDPTDTIHPQATTLDAGSNGVQAMLYQLESGTPYLIVEALAVQSAGATTGRPIEDPLLRCALSLRAFWRRGNAMTGARSLRGIVLAQWCAWMLAVAASAEPPDSGGNLANPLQTQSFDHLSATRDRPLFLPSRRPVPPPPPPVEPSPKPVAPPPPPDVALFGIVIDAGGARAIVRSGAGQIERVQIGDAVGGWKVSKIEGRRLVLSLDDRFATFTMFSDHGGKRPPDQAISLQVQQKRDQAQQKAPQASPATSRRRR